MKTLWDETARRDLHVRVDRLRPEARGAWGKMSCSEMVAHLVEGMRMGAGEFPTKPRRTVARRWPLKYVFLYLLPMPKHVPAPSKQLVTQGREVDWNASLAAFHRSLDDFAARDRNGAWPEHPYFGTMSGRAWGVIGWKHADHHLRQFGV